jgi:hypothetical protein
MAGTAVEGDTYRAYGAATRGGRHGTPSNPDLVFDTLSFAKVDGG